MKIRHSRLGSRCLLIAALLLPALSLAQAPPAAPQPNPAAPLYQSTGEQYRIYEFPGTGEPIPYRLYVPETWTAEQHLPVLITLRAGNSINNNHRDGNDLVTQAREHGYIVISPLGYRGYAQPYYGSRYPVIRPNGPSTPAAGWSEEDDARAEQDVLYVLGLVAAEYGADTSRVFIHGQNPSGSAAMHFIAKYPDTFKAAVISSGPIVTDDYPFANIAGKVAVFVLHGDKDTNNPIAASEAMANTLRDNGVETEYLVVPGGEHLNAYLLVADRIYDFLDGH
ncbi:MAG: prolyl oligopeptidase family serine peptidase [Pseudomonadales bacterium]|jgi:poly(3-hydroxybutyrate) depolymerase|nr:prolyl oligopeptidase family serine peptidase [Pseudomonadales bacterium]